MNFKLFLENNHSSQLIQVMCNGEWRDPHYWLVLADALEDEGGYADLFRQPKAFSLNSCPYHIYSGELTHNWESELSHFEHEDYSEGSPMLRHLSPPDLLKAIQISQSPLKVQEPTHDYYVVVRTLPVLAHGFISWDKYEIKPLSNSQKMNPAEYDAFLQIMRSLVKKTQSQ